MEVWRKAPVAAKRYIFYHCLVTPTLFVWYVVPYLMLVKGLTVEEAGFIFTVGSVVSAGLSVVVGRFLDKRSPNAVMALVSVVDSSAYMLYYTAFVLGNPLFLVLAAIVEKLSTGMYSVYPVYEYLAYPEDIREKIYVFHNILPLLSQAVTYPVLGYFLGVVFADIDYLVTSVLVFAVASLVLAVIPVFWLPYLTEPVGKHFSEERQEKCVKEIPREFYPVALIIIMLGFAYSIAPFLALVNLFIENFGGGLFEISLYEAAAGLTVVFLSLPVLKISKNRARMAVGLGLLLEAVSQMLLAFSYRLELAVLSAVLASAGYAIMDPFYMDMLFSKIPEDLRGSLLGGIAGVRKILTICSPAVAGVLAYRISASAPYIVSALLIFAAIALLYFISD
ncbi:MAG: hypothetical protein DRJ63_08070 [Thermoprotei archaeon]|nr:MAG: hypothetical protein DRJ63_08070 [Thermoprotei archaeon]